MICGDSFSMFLFHSLENVCFVSVILLFSPSHNPFSTLYKKKYAFWYYNYLFLRTSYYITSEEGFGWIRTKRRFWLKNQNVKFMFHFLTSFFVRLLFPLVVPMLAQNTLLKPDMCYVYVFLALKIEQFMMCNILVAYAIRVHFHIGAFCSKTWIGCSIF